MGGSRFDACLEDTFMKDREKISNGPNESAINETIAGTGPGIPDEAVTPGQDLPEPPSDEEVARIAKKLGAPIAAAADSDEGPRQA